MLDNAQLVGCGIELLHVEGHVNVARWYLFGL